VRAFNGNAGVWFGERAAARASRAGETEFLNPLAGVENASFGVRRGMKPDAIVCGHTVVRTRRINRAAVVGAEKLTAPISTARDHQSSTWLSEFSERLVERQIGIMRIGFDQTWLAKDIEKFRLDNQMAPTARAALVAFVFGNSSPPLKIQWH
jgi:hypothetical protein